MRGTNRTTAAGEAAAWNEAPVIEIFTGLWTAQVRRDGSGVLWYGSSGGAVVAFPAGTFDTKGVAAGLREKLTHTRPADPTLMSAWLRTDDKTGEVLWEKEPGPIAGMFELFRRAYKQRKAGAGGQDLAGLWRRHAPTPVSELWDAQ